MAQSMTGFGNAEKEGCRIEIRSINHRFLDIYVHAPAFLNQLEIPFRNMLKERFSRGKFDISVTVSALAAVDFSVDSAFVRRIYGVFSSLQEELSIGGQIDINTLIGLHGMFMETKQAVDIDMAAAVFRAALDDLHKMREREGETLAGELGSMAESLVGMNGKISNLAGRVPGEAKEKFAERMRVLLQGQEVDPARVLQEAAVIAARLDISEEITRIESHARQFMEILVSGDIIGRKLDFILQELNREVNTIASKSTDYEISRLTVDMKTVIEKIREQVQNIQ
ncbi:MAG: YicC family protein [Candidatus Sulfobium sp.]